MGGDGEISSLIVWAIAEGRKMAAGINQYLRVNRSVKKAVS
jgi:glutamate synthase (NADPH) small chain